MLNGLLNTSKTMSAETEPDISGILSLIQDADEIPSTERIETLKTEFMELCNKAQKIFEDQDPQEKKVLNLDPLFKSKEDKNYVDWFVVGDIHCDFQSLCRLLLKIYLRPNVNPSKVKIIFLGDYIDRGNRPFEVLKLLLNLKVKWPEHFWMLKGNHETLFKGEDGIVRSLVTPAGTITFWKDYYGEETFIYLAELFDVLPVAFIQPLATGGSQSPMSDQNIFYVHGGIPRTENLLSPLESSECQKAFLWSDPELEKEDVLNGPGRRFSFGKKDFLTFTTHHNIALMVRGHEVRKDGFDLHPELESSERQIVTIHSCGGKGNEDSHYGSEILVPRFLHMCLDNYCKPVFSVEEIYRDDLLVTGGLFDQHPEYFKTLVGCFETVFEHQSEINLNIKAPGDTPTNEDSSDVLDTSDFFVWLRFLVGADSNEIEYQININSYRHAGSFFRASGSLEKNVSELISGIRDVYPIFGQTSTHFFKTLKED